MSAQQLAFRETFLWRLSRPDAAETFRAAGDILFDLLNEAGEWGPPDSNEDSMKAELRAVATDLEHMVDDLERMTEELRRSEGPEEARTADLVNGWLGRLARVMLDMQRHLGP